MDRVLHWAKQTYDEYNQARSIPNSGVRFEEHLRFCIDPDDSASVLQFVDEWQRVDGANCGVACADAYLVTLPVIDVPVFMTRLKKQVADSLADFVIREIASPTELFPEFDLVVNCTGVGAHHFADDSDVFPIRSQVLRVSRPAGLHRSTRIYRKDDDFTLVLPRTNDVILGGTTQEGDWDRRVRQTDSTAILQRCGEVVPEIREAEILGAFEYSPMSEPTSAE